MGDSNQSHQMVAIMGPDSEEPFQAFLCTHRENDAEAISMFKMVKQMNPESLALKLADYLGPNSFHELYYSEECAELLHKLLITDDGHGLLCIGTWRSRLGVSTQSTIKCVLLDHMELEEESRFVIQELRETIWKLAASLLPDNNWPDYCHSCINASVLMPVQTTT